MGVGDEDMRHRFAAHGVEQRRDMGVVVRPGIEDRHVAAADDVADRALERERARIVGGHRAHQRRHLFHPVGLEIERLVERDVIGHAHTLLRRAAMMCTARTRRASKGYDGLGEAWGVQKIMEPPVPGSPGAPATSFNTTSETEIAACCYANRGPSSGRGGIARIWFRFTVPGLGVVVLRAAAGYF